MLILIENEIIEDENIKGGTVKDIIDCLEL